jgi:hypothetical protein
LKKPKTNSSGFKGVTFDKDLGKWKAQIEHHGKHEYLGVFVDPAVAHQAYCAAAKMYHGEFANYGASK